MAAFAAHRLADQERRRALPYKHGRMELHVFQVDHPRAHAVPHSHAVAVGARIIGGMKVDLAKAAGRQHRLGGDDRVHLAGGGVQHVGAETGERLVFVQRIGRAVRQRQKVDGHGVRGQADARRVGDRPVQGGQDRLAGLVLGEQDARRRVGGLSGHAQIAAAVAFERNVELVHQQVAHRRAAAFDHEVDGARIGGAGAGGHDVATERLRVDRRIDDAALGTRAVALGGARLAGQQDAVQAGLGGLVGVGGAGQAAPDDQAIGADRTHQSASSSRLRSTRRTAPVSALVEITSTPVSA